ncbi:MAG: hypothetical protein HN380_23405 [Victivallales bacterium]|nr:hypothetical protein [Victivallales bacterium]
MLPVRRLGAPMRLDQQWRQHYEQLPARLVAENVCPTIPWLYNFKLDFRFR